MNGMSKLIDVFALLKSPDVSTMFVEVFAICLRISPYVSAVEIIKVSENVYDNSKLPNFSIRTLI